MPRALTNHPSIPEIADRIRPLCHRHSIERAIVFGSIARGDASRHSDLDLVLIRNDNRRFLDRTEDVQRELQDLFGECPVEVLVYTPKELAAMSHRPFIRTILDEGVCIYEQSPADA